jgi:cation diffusion facilitator CzcD-associated flavoprotein CzcO
VSGRRLDVCVVGAGTSGLAAVHCLTRAGHEVTAFEAGSALGGMWRYENDNGLSAAYGSLSANTSRRRMEYSSLPMSRSAPAFPKRDDVLAYLEAFAREHDLGRRIEFNSWVERVRPAGSGVPGTDGGARWQVSVRGAAPRVFDAVVVASGHYWDAQVPQLAGGFAGDLLHARDYRTPERFAGRRVVVVGGAQSALDIVAEISTVAERAMLASGEVHHLLPGRMFGRPYDDFDTPLSALVPLRLSRLVARSLMALARATPDRGELPPPRHRMFETRWPLVVSPTVQAALAERAFESRPRLRALAGERVVFDDGSEEEADVVIFATGYRINFPFLPAELGRGDGWEFPLYRRILAPEATGLAFIGVLEPGPGLFAVVERQAIWLGEVLAGRLPLPPRERRWEAIDAGGERRSRRQFAATGRHTILCNRHAYLRTLARDLRGASHPGAAVREDRPPVRASGAPAAGESSPLRCRG